MTDSGNDLPRVTGGKVMKDEKKRENGVRQHRIRACGRRFAAVFAAALLSVFTLYNIVVPRVVHAALDLSQPCSLTIRIGETLTEAEREDLRAADIVYDLYRVADAVPVDGYDTYAFEVTAPFAEALSKDGSRAKAYLEPVQDGTFRIASTISSDGWKAVAAEAGLTALGTVPEGEKTAAPQPAGAFSEGQVVSGRVSGAGESLSVAFDGLKAGLYLIIPHGANIEKYVAAKTSEDGGTVQATIADSAQYEYSFSPELAAIPTKAVDENGQYNTGNAGEWIQSAQVDISLKFARERRAGNLEITKTLLTYAEREKTTDGSTRAVTDPATFIFEVLVYESEEAYRTGGAAAVPVYHNFISIVFDANGDYGIIGAEQGAYAHGTDRSKTVRIENLPIGAFAVVKEVYSGKIYTADTDRQAVIELNDRDNTVGVEFENDYNDEHGGGGSVTNKFTYSEAGGWVHEQVTDSSQDTSTEDPITRHGNQ